MTRLYPELVEFTPGDVYHSDSDVRLSVVIMGHVNRQPHIDKLASKLRTQGIEPGLSIDSQPPLRKTTERYETTLWTNARSAWAGWHPDATHHMVIQDDVLICRDFIQTMSYFAWLMSEAVICPYSERDYILRARANNEAWALNARGILGLCSMWPVDLLADAVGWIDAHFDPEFRWDDARFNIYNLAHNRMTWVTAPSLIQHACPERADSLVAHGGDDRKSRWWVGANGSGLDVYWEAGRSNPSIRVEGWGHLDSEFSRQYYHLDDVPYQPATSHWHDPNNAAHITRIVRKAQTKAQENPMAKRIELRRGYRGVRSQFQYIPPGEYVTDGELDLSRNLIPGDLATWLVEYKFAVPLGDEQPAVIETAQTDESVEVVPVDDWRDWPDDFPITDQQREALEAHGLSFVSLPGVSDQILQNVDGVGPATVTRIRDWFDENVPLEEE